MSDPKGGKRTARSSAAPAARAAATRSSKPAKPAARRTRRSRGEDDRRSLSRLERILLLVPYVVRNPGVTVDELAARFGATRKEILEDLDLVFMCGLPDYTPADLIDVVVEGESVSIRMADYFARPLRLTRSEAIPLYVKGQALLDLLRDPPPGGDRGVDELGPLRSALSKLRQALLPQDGSVAELTERIRVHLEAGEAKWLPVLRDAVTTGRRVDIEYYTYGRDTLTQRRVDPYLVFASFGHWYVHAYCHMVDDRRMFRLDRIKSLELTDETFEAPPDAVEDLPPSALYEPGPEDHAVTIRASARAAALIEDYKPVESARAIRGGWRELKFKTSQFPWLEKLLLSHGTEVEIVEPPELAERVAQQASAILKRYRSRR